MNIEPAMLLMVYSIPRYIDVTHTLLEFLFLLVDSYDVEHKDSMAKGVSSSFSVLVKKGVIRSLDVLTSCDALSRVMKERLVRFLSDLQQAHFPGHLVCSGNSSCMGTPLSPEHQPQCSPGERFSTMSSDTSVMISDDAAPWSISVMASNDQIRSVENLIERLGEATEKSGPPDLCALEELLLSFVA
ncbi:hypothetical protein M0R45_031063 [Rubus argutus]|uniref:Integrator complex subunit 3 N-terminal domain-containing protein n=1 Tax=Rubus argutus TaxID=59490 RepID=A0AAW1WH81_RUBAR